MIRLKGRKRLLLGLAITLALVAALPATGEVAPGPPEPSSPNQVVRQITGPSQREEMTVNTSRILTLDKRIPQAQVNNPDILDITALSPTQIQIFAKKAGVTQVNLWDEKGNIYTIDVIVFGDARELDLLLKSQFPNCSIKVIPIASGVLLSGYVDQQEHVSRIIQIAEEYYPRVINNLTLGGVHEVLLHVKVMEVSRTKLRALGFDWTQISGQNVIRSSVSGLISAANAANPAAGTAATAVTSGGETFFFSVFDGNDAFFGVLEALRQDNLMKVLAEPTLVTVSGRPAFFQVGGEFPIIVPQSLGTVSIEYKRYGTQVDFVPIVLGNGRIRLEVRPRVSEIDSSRSVVINSTTVPGLRVREVDTGVEMQAGQTLAIAGLVETRVEAQRRGVPVISDLPYIGSAFRRVAERSNDVELLILVTPELVDAMNAEEVPPCGPGTETASPTDWELFMKGYIEVPRCCDPSATNGAVNPAAGQPTPAPGPSAQSAQTGNAASVRVARSNDGSGVPGLQAASPYAVSEGSSTTTFGKPGVVPQTRSARFVNDSSSPKPQPRPSEPSPLPGFKGEIGYDN
ncbi:MAG TPA: pilus assembly protein N-terminal domain-containing protein [Thermogutta sp.]|nr:pilus assembly protein N-terminal domain-containing protein [Thermogutta sp.]